MKRMIPLLVVLALGARAQTDKYSEISGLPALPSYAVKAVKEKPVIDGRLSEKAWATAAPIILLFPWEDQTGAKQRTTVKLLRDQNYLYVGYECEDADITATYENRDDPVYKDDCVEIFIRPDEKSDHYIGLEMNARGVLYDYFYPFPSKLGRELDLDGVLLTAVFKCVRLIGNERLRRVSTASGSERGSINGPNEEATLATARGTDPAQVAHN